MFPDWGGRKVSGYWGNVFRCGKSRFTANRGAVNGALLYSIKLTALSTFQVHIMKLLELPVFPLHSSLQQRQRFKYLEKFTKSSCAVLVRKPNYFLWILRMLAAGPEN